MRRTVIMALLGLGVIGGFGSGFAHMARWHRYQQQQREAFVGAMAERCSEASLRQQQRQAVVAPAGSGTTIINIGIPATVTH